MHDFLPQLSSLFTSLVGQLRFCNRHMLNVHYDVRKNYVVRGMSQWRRYHMPTRASSE